MLKYTPPPKKKNQILHYHLILHCEVLSSCEMVSVAPSRRAEAINRNLRSILTWIRPLSKMWSSVWSSSECRLDLPLDGLKGQYFTGHVVKLKKKKKSQYNID